MDNAPSLRKALPVGTQVVTRVGWTDRSGNAPAGAVGVIIEAPSEAGRPYRVRFPDGVIGCFSEGEIVSRKRFQRDGLESDDLSAPDSPLYECVIYRCIVGSRAYGLDESGSDTDTRGIYLPPADLQWSLAGVPEQIENSQTEETYWEVRKFLILALKANPNILECLYTPLVVETTPLADELLSTREMFLSRLVYQTYSGYVVSQFKKLEGDIRNHGQIKWKHAMHLIRLLLSGITILREGYVPVNVQEHRGALLRIRRGETDWEEINDWRLRLHREFEDALKHTTLPERPDYERADRFLIKARRSKVVEG